MGERARRLTVGPANHFFGYYGIPAWSRDGTFHAALETDFHRRPPVADDVARVGVVQNDGTFDSLGTTSAFNLQQGAMMFWLDDAFLRSGRRELSYNAWDGDRLVARVVDVDRREQRTLERPLAAVSHAGSQAIGLDFARMYHCRAVVGYANDLARELDPAPSDDGLFAVNTATGGASLMLSIAEVAARMEAPRGTEPYWFNHVVYRPDDRRFVFLARGLHEGRRLSSLWSVRTDGSDLVCHIPFGHWVSHFAWLNDRDLLVSTDMSGRRQFLWLNTHSNSFEPALPGLLPEDGHPAFSSDGRHLVCDSYPGSTDRRARLVLVDLTTNRARELGAFYSEPLFTGDIRCDLHPRWARDDRSITFDSVHEGDRQIYSIAPGWD